MRVAFSHITDEGWTGRTHYLKNVFFALRSLKPDRQPEILLLVSQRDKPSTYEDLKPYINEVLILPPASAPSIPRRLMTRLQTRMGIRDERQHPVGPFLRSKGVQALFVNSVHYGPRLGVPLLVWIPDFQHLHLPEMFSEDEIKFRTQRFQKLAQYACRVILSSHDAWHDYAQFAPGHLQKVRILPFVAQVSPVYDQPPRWICDYYHLPERFIHLPNQFWKHKNHLVVIKALELARNQRPAITVVCTGHTVDYRNPGFFSELLVAASTANVRGNLIFLGLVSHPHVFHLMRQSQAVLQPSLFEGWSTTVEEAKSLGKQVILSDIPVHREQSPPGAYFFEPNNPESLANCLLSIYDETEPGPDYRLEAIARAQLPIRTAASAQEFLQILSEVVG